MRVNAGLLNKRLVGAGNIEPVDFAEVPASPGAAVAVAMLDTAYQLK